MYLSIAVKLLIGMLGLILFLRISGKTQMAQLTPLDSVNSFVLGALVGGVIYNPDTPVWYLLFAFAIWTAVNVALRYMMRFRNIDEAGAHLIVALAREDEREIDVILERERVEQVELLKHEPEMIAAERGGLAFADLGKVPPVEQHRAGGGLVERGENVQERRFAAAALAHDGDILALVHGEIDVAERLDRIAAEAGLIYLFQPGNFQ